MELIVCLSMPFFQVGVLEKGHVPTLHTEKQKNLCSERLSGLEAELVFPNSSILRKILLLDRLSRFTFLKKGWRLFVDFSSTLSKLVFRWLRRKALFLFFFI